MIENALFVTGAQRSGTTLLEKLLGAQARISMLSQPFPLLFPEVKRAFLGDGDPYPLGHLFLETRHGSEAFARFLRDWRTSRAELEGLFARMQDYSGQYTRFDSSQLDAAFSTIAPDDDFAEVVGRLDRSLARKPDARWFGSKETVCEEYVPPLLDRGFYCAIILRDPRDIVASLNHGRGREFGGDLKPTLFNVRSWRKSVAIALAMSGHPRFHFCRYEDLVADPKRELERLAAAFDLGDTVVPDEIRDDAGVPWRGNSSHGEHPGIGTSSVATWRQVLPPEVAELIEATCLPELQCLGYETSLTRAEAVRTIESFREPYTITRMGMESDAYSAANATVEIERLGRVSQTPDADSARWFVHPKAHAHLREGCNPTVEGCNPTVIPSVSRGTRVGGAPRACLPPHPPRSLDSARDDMVQLIAFARRASAILYGLLRATADPRPFLLPANVCPIVPDTFAAADRRFEPVDIDESSLAMNATQCVERIRTNAFAGVLFVRPYGSERDPTELFAALHAAQPDLLIIDDRCLCRPDCDGKTISLSADVTLFSTGYAKFADIGGGGFAFLRDGVAYAPASEGPAWLDLGAPAVSWEEHKHRTIDAVHEAAEHKKALNAIYARTIPAHVQLPKEFQQWRFNVRVPDAGRLVDAAFAAGLFASRHYPALGDFPVAAGLHADIVNLFNDRYFTEAQAQQMADLVRAHLD